MSIPFEKLLSELSPERQEKIKKRAAELIEEQEKVADCCHLIDASGSATELASFYNHAKNMIDYHKLGDFGFLAGIRNAIVRTSGIPDEYINMRNGEDSIFSKALENYNDKIQDTQI